MPTDESEHWRLGNGRGKALDRNLSHCHTVHHKIRTDYPEVELWPSRREDGDKPSELMHGRRR